MDIRFGELYTIEVKPTKVAVTGRTQIIYRLRRRYDKEIPQDWDWSWMVQKGEFRGGLPKRIASFFKKQYGIKISSDDVTYLGNLAKRHCHVGKTYTFDFTKCFDWMAGDFGDHGSCYWGCRNLAREALMRNGVIAVRFYRGVGREGFARAWVKPIEEGMVVFNAYGLPCRTISYVLSTLFDNPPPRSVDLFSTGDPDTLVWLNAAAHTVGLDTSGCCVTLELDVPYKLCGVCDEFVYIDNYMHGEGMCKECYADS